MRANIEVVGLGQRRTGVSNKNGTQRAYDFQPVSILFDDQWTTGRKAATVNVSGTDIDAMGGLMIGGQYDAVYHQYQNTIAIDAILAQLL